MNLLKFNNSVPCLACERPIKGARIAHRDQVRPGNFVFCSACGHVMIIGLDYKIRNLGPKEVAYVRETPALFAQVREHQESICKWMIG